MVHPSTAAAAAVEGIAESPTEAGSRTAAVGSAAGVEAMGRIRRRAVQAGAET